MLELSIGRDDCAITLDSDFVSARHASLIFDRDGSLRLRDEASRNGSFTLSPDGQETRIGPEPVDVDLATVLRLGDERLRVSDLMVETGSWAELLWISVGDCLKFLFRDGRLTHLNADHSMAPMLNRPAETGEVDPAEARDHPDRHALMSAVTGGPLRLIDAPAEALRVHEDDCILLSSDGPRGDHSGFVFGGADPAYGSGSGRHHRVVAG